MNSEVEYETIEVDILLIEDVESPRMRALEYLFALQKRVYEIEQPVERGLMHVEALVNHKASNNTTVDSGATHNFMTRPKRNNQTSYGIEIQDR